MTGLSFDPIGDDFILRRVTESGETTQITLSGLEVLTLTQMAEGLRAQILARQSTQSRQAIVAMPVTGFVFHQELMGEKLLVTLVFGTHGASNMTVALDPGTAADLAAAIPEHLNTMLSVNRTKQ